MKKLLFILAFLFSFNLTFSQTDEYTVSYKESISKDSLSRNIEFLQNFGSRNSKLDNRKDIAIQLRNKLISYDWESKIDSFLLGDLWQYNIVAEKKGSEEREEIVIIGAHYDSSGSFGKTNEAPGANDNASGVSAILEMARIFQKHNLSPLRTIRIELYGAEEQWMIGSYHAAKKAFEQKDNIVAMINLDIIAFDYKEQSWSFQLIEFEHAKEYADFCEEVTKSNTNLNYIRTFDYNGVSDSRPYADLGYNTIYLFDLSLFKNSWKYLFYHTEKDVLDNLDLDYFTEMSKNAFAILYSTANTNNSFVSLPSTKNDKIKIRFFEQPSKNRIKFNYNSKTINNDNLMLYDCFGRTVLHKPLKSFLKSDNNFEIETYNLKSGYYILNIVSDKYTASEKVMIVK